jgi:type IV pilus assembly protein PilX
MNKKTQTGFVLISALIFLVLMIYLGLAMFRGFGLDQIMAGNLREKSRATEAAQAAVNGAEWWLIQPGHATIGTTCGAGTQGTNPKICSNVPTLSPALSSYFVYTPANMTISTTGGVGTYSAAPQYYIYYLGADSKGRFMYTVTAQAQGGNQNAVATLQTVYRVGCLVCDLGG